MYVCEQKYRAGPIRGSGGHLEPVEGIMATGTWGPGAAQRVFRVNIHFIKGGQKCQTGFHLRETGLLDTADPDDVANAVSPWVTTKFVTLLTSADRVDSLDVENLVTKEGFTIAYPNALGTLNEAQCPSFLMFPVSIKGNVRRRYGNGRMLWPVMSKTSFDGNTLTAGALALANTVTADLADRFMTGAFTDNLQLVHLHPALPAVGTRPAIPATWYDATALRINGTVSALRRRKVGVGQ